MTLNKFKPDTPKEYAFVGSALARLGSAVSAVLVATDARYWVFLTLFITWLGHELNGYFKMQGGEPVNEEVK